MCGHTDDQNIGYLPATARESGYDNWTSNDVRPGPAWWANASNNMDKTTNITNAVTLGLSITLRRHGGHIENISETTCRYLLLVVHNPTQGILVWDYVFNRRVSVYSPTSSSL